MTFFCPVCWKEIRQIDKICPFCNANLPEYENKHFEEKLINALRHPERETVQRAVYILGKRKSTHAVKSLLDLFKETNNTFLKIGILNALQEIDTPAARDCMRMVIDSDKGLMRRMARKITNRIHHVE